MSFIVLHLVVSDESFVSSRFTDVSSVRNPRQKASSTLGEDVTKTGNREWEIENEKIIILYK